MGDPNTSQQFFKQTWVQIVSLVVAVIITALISFGLGRNQLNDLETAHQGTSESIIKIQADVSSIQEDLGEVAGDVATVNATTKKLEIQQGRLIQAYEERERILEDILERLRES